MIDFLAFNVGLMFLVMTGCVIGIVLDIRKHLKQMKGDN